MKTSELTAFLKSPDFKTETQAYNLIVGDLFEFCTEAEIEASQRVIQYFNYKITAVLLPVIQELKAAQVEAFKAGIKTASLSAPYNSAKEAVKP